MMNNFPSRESVERVRTQYPVGSRVELVKMDDAQAPPVGTKGTVRGVDDIGSILVAWDNGSSLSVAFGEDIIRLLSKAEVIKEQCRKIAATGRTNMFDTKAVFEIALELGFGELADFMFMNTAAYGNLIFTGELHDEDVIIFP